MKTVLFFENYSNLKLLAKEECSDEDFNILLPQNSDEALEMAKKSPDAIVTDINPQTDS